ncbi:MAG: hypothetical protein R3F61_34340 [Myxococcota bacterium]
MHQLQFVVDRDVSEREILALVEPVLARHGLKRQRNSPTVDLHEWEGAGVFVTIARQSWAGFWWVHIVSHDDSAPGIVDELRRAELVFDDVGQLRMRARSPGRRGDALVRLAHAVSLDGDGPFADLVLDVLERGSDDEVEGAVRAAAHLAWPIFDVPLERIAGEGGWLGELADEALHREHEDDD